MKNLLTFVLSLSVVVFGCGTSVFAQGKGPGGGPGSSISQGHGQSAVHDQDKSHSDAHSNSSSHEGKTDWETRLNDRMKGDSAFGAKIQSLLPQGTDLKTAEAGFKNQGQFIAALHVSKNLNIPFDQLKAKMTGISGQTGQTTTSSPMSLGKAIHELRPAMSQSDANDEAKRAEKQVSTTEKSGSTASD